MNFKITHSFKGLFIAIILLVACHPLEASQSVKIIASNDLLIKYADQDTVKSENRTDSRKNIISVDFLIMFPALGYSRILPLTEKKGLVFYLSITPYFDGVIDLGGALTIGKNHHFFEPGGGYLLLAHNVYIKAGYRYQGKRGFVFRVAPGYSITENVPWFTTSFGYAF